MSRQLLVDEPDASAIATLIFAHGAGAPMDSDFMLQMTKLLCEQRLRVVRFEFPYMVERRENGKRRPPNRQPELLQCFGEVVGEVKARYSEPLFLAGKSMGGRMASLLVASEQFNDIEGVVCFGYPFHPQGKPEKLRTEHLLVIDTPILMLQGSRDPLGNYDEVKGYGLSSSVEVFWLDDGDHDLKPRVKSGHTHTQHLRSAAARVAEFIQSD